MRRVDRTVYAPMYRHKIDANGTAVYFEQIGSFVQSYLRVASGPILRGNHKTPNPWWFAKSTRNAQSIRATWTSGPDGLGHHDRFTFEGPYTQVPEGLASERLASLLTQTSEKATSQLLERIRASDTDVSVDAMRAHQTLELGNQVLQFVRDVKVVVPLLKSADALVSAIKVSGSAWLTWQYGLRPTLKNIYDIANFQSQLYSQDIEIYSGSATARESVTVSLPNWPDPHYWNAKCELDISARSKAQVSMRIPNDTLTQAARLSSLNPASIAWELVPFSFVADWFLDLGGYLRDIETRAIYNRYFVAGFKTDTYKVEHNATAFRNGSGADGSSWTGDYQCYGTDRGLHRDILTSLPSVPRPSIQCNLGAERLLSAASLLSNLLEHRLL